MGNASGKCMNKPEGAAGVCHMVHPVPVIASGTGQCRGHLGGTGPLFGGKLQKIAKDGFHGAGHEGRASKEGPGFRVGHEGKVVVHAFAEAYARVEHDPVFRQPCADEACKFLFKEVCHFLHDVRIDWMILHVPWPSLAVHEHIARLVLDKDIEKFWIKAAGRDVVDNLHAMVQNGSGCPGMVGVHGEDGLRRLCPQGIDDGHKPLKFRLRAYRLGSWTGGLGSKVDNVGALVKKAQGSGNGSVGGRAPALGEKGVRGQVDNAQDACRPCMFKRTCGNVPVRFGSVSHGGPREEKKSRSEGSSMGLCPGKEGDAPGACAGAQEKRREDAQRAQNGSPPEKADCPYSVCGQKT